MRLRVLSVICLILSPAGVFAQRERQLPPPQDIAYGSKFFEQLRSIFGRFRDSDLQHAFEVSRPIQCSELVGGKGEWREVAFFNEDRRLGDWCRESIEEVKSDLAVFRFKGECGGERGPVQVSTEFPVAASIEAYNRREIDLDGVDINVNAPVTATLDSRTTAYTFELPYLFRTGRQGSMNIYSFNAPTRNDAYASEVTSRWECKAVKSDDVTYRFLICRTATVSSGRAGRGQRYEPAFGASAFFILSDGMEAQSAVNISYGDSSRPAETPAPANEPDRPALSRSARAKPKVRLIGGWETPESLSRLTDAGAVGFRLRFNAQTWAGKIRSAQLLSDQKMASFRSSSRPQEGADYCIWRPEAADVVDGLLVNPPDEGTVYSMAAHNGSGPAPATIVFSIKTPGGVPLGSLECSFPRTESASSVTFDRWISVVGGHLMLDVRR